jgi:hypothetical protein
VTTGSGIAICGIWTAPIAAMFCRDITSAGVGIASGSLGHR